jgi:hypothetical protein
LRCDLQGVAIQLCHLRDSRASMIDPRMRQSMILKPPGLTTKGR